MMFPSPLVRGTTTLYYGTVNIHKCAQLINYTHKYSLAQGFEPSISQVRCHRPSIEFSSHIDG